MDLITVPTSCKSRRCTRCDCPAPNGYRLNGVWYCDPCYELVLTSPAALPRDENDRSDRARRGRLPIAFEDGPVIRRRR